MRKQLLLIFLLGAITYSAQAQIPVELKINPAGIIRSTPDLSLEFIISEYIGAEGKIGFHVMPTLTIEGEDFSGSGVTAGVWGKYYFLPTELNGGDGFYGSAYVRYSNLNMESSLTEETGNWLRTSIGAAIGYKWVANNYIVIEGGIGLGIAAVNRFNVGGRNFNLQGIPLLGWFDLPIVLSVGYRFNNG